LLENSIFNRGSFRNTDTHTHIARPTGVRRIETQTHKIDTHTVRSTRLSRIRGELYNGIIIRPDAGTLGDTGLRARDGAARRLVHRSSASFPTVYARVRTRFFLILHTHAQIVLP